MYRRTPFRKIAKPICEISTALYYWPFYIFSALVIAMSLHFDKLTCGVRNACLESFPGGCVSYLYR
jgi:hypothetical protein